VQIILLYIVLAALAAGLVWQVSKLMKSHVDGSQVSGSLGKYVAGRTTVSFTFKSYPRLPLPAVTICPGYKMKGNLPEGYKEGPQSCNHYRANGTYSYGEEGIPI